MADHDHTHDDGIQFGVDPTKVPILYAEGYLITSNNSSIVFNFAQPVLDNQQQNIVSRIAMTRDQAKQFLATLDDHIEKFEL
jgi:hypothetical protein